MPLSWLLLWFKWFCVETGTGIYFNLHPGETTHFVTLERAGGAAARRGEGGQMRSNDSCTAERERETAGEQSNGAETFQTSEGCGGEGRGGFGGVPRGGCVRVCAFGCTKR